MSLADLTLRDVAAIALLVPAIGLLLCGGLGALVLRDPLSRLHGTRLATGFGAPLFLAGLACVATGDLLAHLLALALVCTASAPAILHLIANAAYERARERTAQP